jgi:hypothetical protein
MPGIAGGGGIFNATTPSRYKAQKLRIKPKYLHWREKAPKPTFATIEGALVKFSQAASQSTSFADLQC